MESRTPTAAELFKRDHLTPEELAELLERPVDSIYTAAFRGDLKATIVEHMVLQIRREDILAWLGPAETK